MIDNVTFANLKRALPLSVLLFLPFSPIKAAQTPQPLEKDTRIKQFTYEEDNVFMLDLHLKAITSVQLADGEMIESVLVGDSASWEIIRLKRGNVISIKPLTMDALTNMTIYTDRRIYTFELRAVGEVQPSGQSTKSQNYRAKFRYPLDEAKEVERKAQEATEIAELEEEKKKREAAAHSHSNKNYNYYASGRSEFDPVSVFDDGVRTYFRFPKSAPKPAIYSVNSDKKESLVNLRTQGSFVVVDAVSSRWSIRIGGDAIFVAEGRVIKK